MTRLHNEALIYPLIKLLPAFLLNYELELDISLLEVPFGNKDYMRVIKRNKDVYLLNP